jgi:RNA polymerase sigma-B factor
MARAPLEDLDRIAEEYASALRVCTADEVAARREEMIRSALPFAGRLAHRYRAAREPLADLEQVARLGLIKAVDRYEPERGSFTAYAVMTVVGELKRHFRDHTWAVHVPRRLQDLSMELRRAEAGFVQEHRRRPTDAELATLCDLDPAEIFQARAGEAGNRPVSLARPIGDDPGELGDLLGAPDPAVETITDSVTLSVLMRRLPEREQRILSMRFSGNQTQSAIAEAIGVSQMQVSRLITRSLAWLREAMLTDSVPPWPGEDDDLPDRFRHTAVVTAPGHLQVAVAGEIDRDNAPRLRRVLLDLVARYSRARALRLDLGGVPLLDAAAIGVLLAVHEAARVRGVAVTVTGLQPFARHIAEVSGLSALLAPDTD